MGCNCGKPKCKGQCGCKSPAVLQINNPSEYVAFHKVTIPAAMGDSTTNPPKNGKFRNALVWYEADNTSWMYSSDGIPTQITGPQGPQGEQGPAGTIAIGTTTTGDTGTDAEVENVGTPENAILNFTIPRGERGEQGIQGETGPQGYMNEQDVTDVVNTIIPEGFFDDEATVSDCGDGLNLDNVAGGSAIEFEIKGNTFQQNYTGENLVGLDDYPETTAGGVTYSIRDNVLSVSGSASAAVKIPISKFNVSQFVQGDKPRITVLVESGTWTAGAIGVEFYVGTTKILTQQMRYDGAWARANAFTGNPSQVTSADVFIGKTFSGTNLKARVMLTNRTEASTEYEPFVGGEPSPSPDFPQPVLSVTGRQIVSINGTDYPLDLDGIKLCGIENDGQGNFTYRDKIIKDGENWKLHKETDYVSLDTSKNHTINLSATDTARITFPGALSTPVSYRPSRGFSAICKGEPTGGWSSDEVGFAWSTNTNVWWRFSKTSVGNTEESVENWADGKIFDIYYPLATPTDTIITDSRLIEQLDSIMLERGVNSITVSWNEVDGEICLGAYANNWNGAISNVYTKGETDNFRNSSNYYSEIIYSKERHNNTDCYIAEVPMYDNHGEQIAPYAAYHPDLSPMEYAQKNFTSLTVNSSMSVGFNYDGRYPTVISNGEIVNNYTGTPMPTNEYWYLGITENRELKTYTSDTTAEAMLADGAIQAFQTFGKIVDNGIFVPPQYSWAGNPHPRMAMGEKTDGTLILIAADGRTDINTGLTESELAQIFIDKGCINAWNFDGGGSTSMTINGSKINRNIDGSGTEDRPMHVTLNFKKKTVTKTVAESFSNTGVEKQKLIQQIIPYVNDISHLVKDTRRIDGEDLNDLVGTNIVAYGNECLNKPVGNNGYFINITYPGRSTNYNKQFYLVRALNQIYSRTMEAGVFSDWIRVDGSNKAFFSNESAQTLASSNVFEPIYVVKKNTNSIVLNLDPAYNNPGGTASSGVKAAYSGGYVDIRASGQMTPATSGDKEICLYRNGNKLNYTLLQFYAVANQKTAISYEYTVSNGTPGDTYEVRISGASGDVITALRIDADING